MTSSNAARLIFGTAVLVMLTGLIAALVYIPIPTGNENTLVQLVGTMSTLAGLVIGYYFGSSEGSVRKTEILGQRTEQATGRPDDPVHVEAE